MAAAIAREPFLQSAAWLLVKEQVIRDGIQLLTVFRRILQAYQPGQAQKHPRALHAVLPAPTVGISLHRHPNGGLRPVEERLVAGLLVSPQVARPEIRFEVR